MASCDDCGARIFYHPVLGAWGEDNADGTVTLACRIFYDTDGGCCGVDYHHPSGSAQKRFRVPMQPERD